MRIMFICALLLPAIAYIDGQVSLSMCANPIVYSPCDLTCTTPHQHSTSVTFVKPPDLLTVIGQCIANSICVTSGQYSISRSTSTTTVFTVLNYTCAESVMWRCEYDGNDDTIDLPCVDFPMTATTTDISDNAVVNASAVITVQLGCLVSEGTVKVKLDYKSSGGTVVDSSSLSTCSNVSQCADPLYSSYECQVNLLKESNVQCKTKYSIEANVKIADAERTESIHLLSGVEFTCTTPTTIPTTSTTSTTSTTPLQKCLPYIERESCDTTYIVLTIIGVVLLVIGLFSAISCLIKRKRNKRDEGECSDDDKGKKNNTNNQDTSVQSTL